MSALAVQAPLATPVRQSDPARPVRRRHLELVGPGFVPAGAATPREDALPARTTAQPRLRLTARGRMVRSLVSLVVATSAAVAVGGWLGSATGGSAQYDGPTALVSVDSGQTLWGIAAASAAAGQDVRDVVSQIQELNALPTGDLVAGQQLVVPAG